MNDTPPDIWMQHHHVLLARSGDERFRMAVSMGRTARTIVWASLPQALSEARQREAFLLRFYGDELTTEQRAEIGATTHRGER